MLFLSDLSHVTALAVLWLAGGSSCGDGRTSAEPNGQIVRDSEQHEEQQQRRGESAHHVHGGGAELGRFRRDAERDRPHDLPQGGQRPKFCSHGSQTLRQDGSVHGGRNQIPLSITQHVTGKNWMFVTYLITFCRLSPIGQCCVPDDQSDCTIHKVFPPASQTHPSQLSRSSFASAISLLPLFLKGLKKPKYPYVTHACNPAEWPCTNFSLDKRDLLAPNAFTSFEMKSFWKQMNRFWRNSSKWNSAIVSSVLFPVECRKWRFLFFSLVCSFPYNQKHTKKVTHTIYILHE